MKKLKVLRNTLRHNHPDKIIRHCSTMPGCQKEKEAARTAQVKEMVASKKLFISEKTPSGGRMKHLSPGYYLKVSGDSLISYLPYFGQATSPAAVSAGGYNFTSRDFEYSITDRKKGGWDIKIKTRDQQENPQLLITIFDNGSASFSITSMSRQSISYSGDL
jgi:hypothetical protein